MGKTAYIVSRFPHLPETFILREMNALQARGVEVELFPLVVQNQAVVHADARPWLGSMHRIRPCAGKTLKSNLVTLLRRPGRYLATFFQMVWYNLPSPKFLARAIYIFPCAVRMAEEMRALGVSHIHAHYATHPALAAWIAARCAAPSWAGPRTSAKRSASGSSVSTASRSRSCAPGGCDA
mgnify:CR=1 FL=1